MGIPQDEVIILGGDLNGHVGRASACYEGIHGGFGHGRRNAEGEYVLEFCDSLGLVLCNTFFQKDENKLISFSSGGNSSVIDYVAVRSQDRKIVSNVKVIASEECVSQHRLMIAEMNFPTQKRIKESMSRESKYGSLKMTM